MQILGIILLAAWPGLAHRPFNLARPRSVGIV